MKRNWKYFKNWLYHEIQFKPMKTVYSLNTNIKSNIFQLSSLHYFTSLKYNLWFGCGASDPYSCVCRPKKQMSLPSICWNANIPFAVYGKLAGASGNLRRMNALTSVDLDVHARTRTVILTSAASCCDKNELTRFSKWAPSFVCTSSVSTTFSRDKVTTY